MLPSNTIYYFPDRGPGHPEFNADGLYGRARGILAPYGWYIFCLNLCAPLFVAFGFSKPSLIGGVNRVVLECSYKKMIGIAARWIIAPMENIVAGIKRTKRKLPRNPMRHSPFATNGYSPISLVRPASGPLPALIGSFYGYLVPKLFASVFRVSDFFLVGGSSNGSRFKFSHGPIICPTTIGVNR